jgi:peptide-methionine (R)-S-oxide reductase
VSGTHETTTYMEKIVKTEEQWRQELDPAAYEVLRHQATERPFTGRYVNEKGDGVYRCAGCGNALFRSDTKFESGSGWPSFTDPMFGEAVETRTDYSHGMVRTEVNCARCGGHLGHVFDDGPGDSGLRYCVNSCALDLERGDKSGGPDGVRDDDA